MEMFLRLFAFSLLLTTGAFLECEICSSSGSTCMGKRETCKGNEDVCAIISVESTLDAPDENPVMKTIKRCYSSENCMSPKFSLTVGHGRHILVYSICCIEDSCAIESPQLEPVSNVTNGMHCPMCFSNGTCFGDKMACTGDDDSCFELVSTKQVGGKAIKTMMKGCSTRETCTAIAKGSSLLMEKTGLVFGNGKCHAKHSGASQTTGLLFPTFSGLLLMKILL